VYIFKYNMVIGAALTHFVNGYGMYVQIFYLPTFYQLAYGYGAVRSASLLLPVVLFQSEWVQDGEERYIVLIGVCPCSVVFDLEWGFGFVEGPV
jgi:hypothetical protein